MGIIGIFCGDWIDCRGTSPLFFICNAVKQTEFTFKSVIDSFPWGARSVESITSGTILSFDAVCAGLPVIIMLQSKETIQWILSNPNSSNPNSTNDCSIRVFCK